MASQPSLPSVFALYTKANLAMPACFHSFEQGLIHSLCLDTVWENLTKTRWGYPSRIRDTQEWAPSESRYQEEEVLLQQPPRYGTEQHT